jgi:hypothetical protein
MPLVAGSIYRIPNYLLWKIQVKTIRNSIETFLVVVQMLDHSITFMVPV